MTNEIRKNLTELTGGMCNRNTPRDIKMQVIEECLNTSAYEFLGFDANGSIVRLRPKFHNQRDKKGRFKAYRG
jgi:hypothetical protein